jgi:hypothetical protein
VRIWTFTSKESIFIPPWQEAPLDVANERRNYENDLLERHYVLKRKTKRLVRRLDGNQAYLLLGWLSTGSYNTKDEILRTKKALK